MSRRSQHPDGVWHEYESGRYVRTVEVRNGVRTVVSVGEGRAALPVIERGGDRGRSRPVAPLAATGAASSPTGAASGSGVLGRLRRLGVIK